MSIISLLQELSKEVVEYENNFFEDVSKFPEYEKEVVEATHKFAARFLGESLSAADEMIRNSGLRKRDYNIQRNLISTVGDISFTHTLFRDRNTNEYRYLLDDMIKLPDRERLTSLAEARILNEAEIYSYQHAA